MRTAGFGGYNRIQIRYYKIQPDSTWKNSTHLGTEYAALLVDSDYHPDAKAADLPLVGGGVAAIATAKGNGVANVPSKTIHFSGYDWIVQASSSNRGGEDNAYDPDNVWTDQKGYLHLRMAERNGQWSCAELRLSRSLGYGSYIFTVQDSAHMGPSAVLGMFTFDPVRSGDFHNEVDIELSRWGNPSSKNAQFVVQPFYVAENVSRFTVPAGVVTHMFRWEPENVSFKSALGTTIGSGVKPLNEHVFVSSIPTPGDEVVHIDLYEYHHSKNLAPQPAEVVIEKFEYLP